MDSHSHTAIESIVTAVTTVSQQSTVDRSELLKWEQSMAKQLRIPLNMVRVAVWEGLQQRGGVLGGAVKVHKTSKVKSNC